MKSSCYQPPSARQRSQVHTCYGRFAGASANEDLLTSTQRIHIINMNIHSRKSPSTTLRRPRAFSMLDLTLHLLVKNCVKFLIPVFMENGAPSKKTGGLDTIKRFLPSEVISFYSNPESQVKCGLVPAGYYTPPYYRRAKFQYIRQ